MSTFAQLSHKAKMKVIKFVSVFAKPDKPTTFIGENASVEMCNSITQYGVTKLMLVTDKMLISLGMHEAVVAKLGELGIDVVVNDNVVPDPTIEVMEAGISLALEQAVDGVLAFGGGSSIDTAKVIAAAVTNNISVPEMEGLFKIKKPALPLFAIPTTAGTGAEASMGAIVSDPARGVKYTCADKNYVPKMAALDPLLTLGLPKAATAATGIDSLVHGIETYVSVLATDETKERARLTIKGVFQHLKVAYDDGQNIAARQGMLQAAFMGGYALNCCGTGYIHAFAHNLGSFYHVPHGQANAYTLVPVLEMIKGEITEHLAEFSVLIGAGDRSESDVVLADKFIQACRELVAAVGIGEKCPELLEKDHEGIWNNAQEEAMDIMGVPSYLNREQAMHILQAIQT